jgi:hypothetical protein
MDGKFEIIRWVNGNALIEPEDEKLIIDRPLNIEDAA